MMVYSHSHVSVNNSKLDKYAFRNEMVMQTYFMENEEALRLEGYDEVKVHGFEVPWKKGKEGRGRIDLLVSYDKTTWAVVELKNDVLTEDNLEQLESYFANNNPLDNVPELVKELAIENPKWMGVLVGTGVSDGLIKKLGRKPQLKNGYPLAVVVVNRFKGSGQTYVFSDVRVAPQKSGKDYTKYRFNGKEYGKGRLVLALVKQCELDGKSLKDARKIGGGFDWKRNPFIMELSLAKRANEEVNSKGNSYTWYFTKEGEAVEFDDAKYAVYYWWGKNDMDQVIKNAKSLGYDVKETD